MRILKIALIFLFTIGLIEIPSYQPGPHSKSHRSCCCKTGICRCQHRPGLQCPLQSVKATGSFSAHSTQSSLLQFLAMNCGTRDEKASSPSYAKEFDLKPLSFWLRDSFEALVPDPEIRPVIFSSLTPDKPPRL